MTTSPTAKYNHLLRTHVYTVAQFSALTGMPRHTVYSKIARKEILSHRIGTRVLIPISEAQRLAVEAGVVPPAPPPSVAQQLLAAAQRSPEPSPTPADDDDEGSLYVAPGELWDD